VETNLVGYFNALAAVLPHFVERGAGTVVIVSSVAGYRGLPKSLVYGATKAALINVAETLYLDLHGKGIGVAVVNPGFVRTPLTAGNDFEMPALIEPDEAAREIVAGLARGAFEIHFPKRFTGWLKLLRLLPYGLYFPAIRRFTGTR
jgi:short-subunit dehydrogenase